MRSVLVRLVTSLMEWGMGHPTFGRSPNAYRRSTVEIRDTGVSPATRREYDDGAGFFAKFEGRLELSDLAGVDLLDLGSGYGGRTIYYAESGHASVAVGVEISEKMARLARASASVIAPLTRVEFLCGRGEQLPLPDGRFDMIVSYDVFEHVENLEAVLGECRRVLRPGGRLYALFPPYYGPRAHHLDFITTLPFLHHLLGSDVLVEAANAVIERHPELERKPMRPVGRRGPLPTLNGVTEREFRRLAGSSGMEIEELSLIGVGWGPGGAARRATHRACNALARLPLPFTRDIFVGTIRCVLRKRADGDVHTATGRSDGPDAPRTRSTA